MTTDPFDIHPGPLWPPWDKHVVPYDPGWPLDFERERGLLHPVVDAYCLGLHHYGSTSVPGLSAKPVIDLMADLREEATPLPNTLFEELARIGYVYRRATRDPNVYFLGKGQPRTHHLQLFPAGSPFVWRRLALRDYLVAHPPAAREYEAVKLRLARTVGGKEYTVEKKAYLDTILDQAYAWYAEQAS